MTHKLFYLDDFPLVIPNVGITFKFKLNSSKYFSLNIPIFLSKELTGV